MDNPTLVTSVLKVFGLNHISLVIKKHHGSMGNLAGEAITESLRSELCVAFLPIATLISEENTQTSRISMESRNKD